MLNSKMMTRKTKHWLLYVCLSTATLIVLIVISYLHLKHKHKVLENLVNLQKIEKERFIAEQEAIEAEFSKNPKYVELKEKKKILEARLNEFSDRKPPPTPEKIQEAARLLKQSQINQSNKESAAGNLTSNTSHVSDRSVIVITKVVPICPQNAKSSMLANIKDFDMRVIVKVWVSAQGRPVKVLYLKGIDGSFGYNEAARDAALRSTFQPAIKDGRAVDGWVDLEYKFNKPQ